MTWIPLLLVLAVTSKDKPRDEPARVTLRFDNPSASEILDEIRRQTGVRVEMDEAAKAVLDPSTRLMFKVEGIPVRPCLYLIFTPRDLVVRWKNPKHALITVRDCAWRRR